MTVRTRFAPSPTGVLHIGNARTALFNWLLARHYDGAFVLRIEDTDKERSTRENVIHILDGLRWLGAGWDEGPYFQSERTPLYQAAIEKLIASGGAYRCRCKPEEIEAKRAAAEATKRKYLYDRACRDKHYGPDEPHVVRCAMPIEGVSVVDDLIKGRVEVSYGELDDWIMVRSDGTTTYNFCVVVDDADMRITHVVRGEDHLTNTHKQLPLYRHLGLTPPAFGHMPLTLGKDRSKLSKRHGAANLLDYRQLGYLPQAMRNFFARLGWAHGDQELFSDEELIRYFDLAAVSASNSIFDMDKLNWINAAKLRAATPDELVPYLLPFLLERGFAAAHDARLPKIIANLQERSRTLVEMADQCRCFYEAPTAYDAAAVKKWWTPAAREALARFVAWLKPLASVDEPQVLAFVEQLGSELNLKLAQMAQPLRLALTGAAVSPPIDATLALIGPAETVKRLEKALAELA